MSELNDKKSVASYLGVSQEQLEAQEREELAKLRPTGDEHLNSKKEKVKRWKSIVTWLIVLVATPATIAVGALLGSRSYIIVSIIVVFLTMVPFFAQFEQRKPQARELVTLAVMIAIVVASRAVFAFVPSFKPVAGLIIITGIAFGASSGFLTGAFSMLVSNFIFGQGPWTPWQMLSYGICGFIFGFLADRGVITRGNWSMTQRFVVSTVAAVFYVLIAGPILDSSSVFWMLSSITPESVIAIYLAGVPINAMQALATFVTIFILANPMLDKLNRVKTKYGMMM